MKAVAQKEYGSINVLKIVELPKPQPGSRDLLVKVHAVAINPIEVKKRINFGNPATTPVTEGWDVAGTDTALQNVTIHRVVEDLILGWDASGVVEAVGSEVKHYKVGDQVYFAGSLTRTGNNAEYALVDERITGRKPANLTHEEAAAIPLTGLTAWEGLIDQIGFNVPTTPEEAAANSKKSVLIINGAGGVGAIAVQVASRILKLQVIATASRPETIDYCKKLGAHHVISHREALLPQLQKIGINEVNGILNCANFTAESFDEWTKIIKPFGGICSIVLSPIQLNLVPLFLKAAKFAWELMYTRSMLQTEDIDRQREILNALSENLEKGVIQSHKTVEFPHMKQLGEAHLLQESGKAFGKIVVSAKFD